MTSMMDREIREQPATIASTIDALLPQRSQLRRLAIGCRSLTLFARGSSDTAAVYGRYLLEIRANLPASLGAPSVATLYRAKPDLSDTLVVVISQSGQTDELIEVAMWARECGARTIAITNGSDSPLANSADIALVTAAGPELAVPATKTYTAQLAALGVLGAALADDADDLVAGLEAAGGEAQRLLADDSAAEAVAEAIADSFAWVVAGRGYSLSSALEIALKAQEVCAIAALGLSGDAPVYCIGGDDRLRSLCDIAISGPRLPEAIAPLVGIIPGQVVVEAIARLRSVDPDRPIGLTKVTQTAQ